MKYNQIVYECLIGLGEAYVNKRVLTAAVALIAVLAMAICAYAEGTISTQLLMRVSRMTQSAVVDIGEDLSMEVNIEGAAPASYQWYYNDTPIDGANQKVYNIVNAKPADSGIYRLDAFDADGKMLVSMDINARVLDPEVPKAGDRTLPLPLVGGAMAAAGAVLLYMRRRETTV